MEITVRFDDYSDEDFKKLQKAARQTYPELKDKEEFKRWVAGYCEGAVAELFEEYVDEELD